MRRVRNSKGQLEDYGQREVALPSEAETPQGWVRADAQQPWTPTEAVVFDDTGAVQRAPATKPLSGAAAITQILKFFNLQTLQRKGKLPASKQQERAQLQQELRDPAVAAGPRNWMRIPVQVDVLVGPGRTPARASDISAGGMRLDTVQGRFMVGTRLDVLMGFGMAGRKGIIVFPTRVAWANEMRGTLGMEFTARPRWEEH
ncbi:MAG: PilZ domain-containing protein [Myxococcota bacterium]